MTDLSLQIAQALQRDHSSLMLGRSRKWDEVSEEAKKVWLRLAQRVLGLIADSLYASAATPLQFAASHTQAGQEVLPAEAEAKRIRSVSASQAAEMLGVNRRTLGQYVGKRGLPYWRSPGGHLRFRLEDIHVWMAKSGEYGPPNPKPPTASEILEMQQWARETVQHFKAWEARRDVKRAALRKAKGLPD